MGKGILNIHLSAGDQALPVGNAKILIRDANGDIIYELVTDENGVAEAVSLSAPDLPPVFDPSGQTPLFAVYTVEVPYVSGYMAVIIHGVQIFDGKASNLPINMQPAIKGAPPEENVIEIFIPHEHGFDMPKVTGGPENFPQGGAGALGAAQALANEVRIPEYITVHLGSPNNTAARNVRVPFIDYVKNVAASEIFPFWDEAALYANIYAQISFALNRIYTVWYRSRGLAFDITNNTAFDQFFVEGRNTFDTTDRIAERIFNMFIRRQGHREPYISSYCNGTTVTCAGMSQSGSQELARQGYTPIQILRYYYPDDVQIVESNNISYNVETYPGVVLREGSSGEDVRTMQNYLNRISGNWYIPTVGIPDGFFGAATKAAVTEFQRTFDLIPDGIIGKATWYAITRVYVAVRELAELTSEGERISIGPAPPTTVLRLNDRGRYVVELQFLLNFISKFFHAVPFVIQDGVFREATKRSVIEFQKEFGLTPDGVVGPATWRMLYDVYYSIADVVPPSPPGQPSIPPFPGVPLRVGSQGGDVSLMQSHLNAIARLYPSIPTVAVDGSFGPATQAAVIAFQRQFGLTADGIIGQTTWYKIIDVFNNLPEVGAPPFPGTALRIGSRGNDVSLMQSYLNAISRVFPVVSPLNADGVFGTGTQASVIAFQQLFGLTPDGVIGRNTWDTIVSVYNNLPEVAAPAFPGTALRVGSRGNDVIIMQKYLNAIARSYPAIPTLTADGMFGSATQAAVTAFQRQFGLAADGVIGRNTWNKIVSVYNLLISGIMGAATAAGAAEAETSGAGAYLASSTGDGAGFNPLAAMLAIRMMRRF